MNRRRPNPRMDGKWLAVFFRGRIVWFSKRAERSSAWLEHLVWDQDVAGSNPVAPTNLSARKILVKMNFPRIAATKDFPNPAQIPHKMRQNPRAGT